jgi:hypothetical protein
MEAVRDWALAWVHVMAMSTRQAITGPKVPRNREIHVDHNAELSMCMRLVSITVIRLSIFMINEHVNTTHK